MSLGRNSSFFGIPGQEKERPDNDFNTFYREVIKLNQDCSFDYFVGEFLDTLTSFNMCNIFFQSLHLWPTSLLNVNGGIGSTKTTPTRGINLKSSCCQAKTISNENWLANERFTGEPD